MNFLEAIGVDTTRYLVPPRTLLQEVMAEVRPYLPKTRGKYKGQFLIHNL